MPMHRQIWRMKVAHPQFRSTWSAGAIEWVGSVRPTELSDTYELRIEYRLGAPPDVHVVTPALRPRSDTERVPHLYTGERLCLFLPWAFEWDASQYIAETTVPWATLWLHHYELWHATTGDWLGGGRHPPPKKGTRRCPRNWFARKSPRSNG